MHHGLCFYNPLVTLSQCTLNRKKRKKNGCSCTCLKYQFLWSQDRKTSTSLRPTLHSKILFQNLKAYCQDGSVVKDSRVLWKPHGGKKESTLICCPLSSTHLCLWTHRHRHNLGGNILFPFYSSEKKKSRGNTSHLMLLRFKSSWFLATCFK